MAWCFLATPPPPRGDAQCMHGSRAICHFGMALGPLFVHLAFCVVTSLRPASVLRAHVHLLSVRHFGGGLLLPPAVGGRGMGGFCPSTHDVGWVGFPAMGDYL